MRSPTEESLFAAALERPAVERTAFLLTACAGDEVLRARVAALLASHDATDNALATVVDPGAARSPFLIEFREESVGQMLGAYKLLEKVGEGGYGVVFVAEQTRPVRRRVAIKVIKLGMDTRAVLARFDAERQALARMDHPNIARVYEAGESESGRPYIAMELVRGFRITEYCATEQLGIRERLDLFVQVCHAVQHAHQKGIIHRDIKPSNILVTRHDGVPVPKVIDFGIAKATEGRLTDATVYTHLHQFIGTPAYMSPEQAEMSGLDIDTRTDIYSLGVLLYELLTGSPPFAGSELLAGGIDGMRRTLREREPERPSTRITQSRAGPRRPQSVPPAGNLAADLDWIVMKCLEKDRTRRYDTAAGLAADLTRHLRNEPVLARPPSAAYRIEKAWARNRLLLSVIAFVALVLAAGIVAATSQARRARIAEAAQSRLRGRAEQLRVQEATARRLAETAQAAALTNLYGSEIKLGFHAYQKGLLVRAREILDNLTPGPGQPDPRGFEWRLLWNLSRQDSTVALSEFVAGREHPGLDAFEVSPDGTRLAALAKTGRIEVWDAVRWRRLGTLDGHKPGVPVARFAFSRDNRMLASATGGIFAPDAPGEVRIWDLDRMELVDVLKGARGGLWAVAISSDRRHLAASDSDDGIVLWNLVSKISTRLDPGVRGTIWSLSFAPDRPLLASSHRSGGITLWEVPSGRRITGPVAHPEQVSRVQFSPNGQHLAAACESGAVLLYATGNWTLDAALTQDLGFRTSLAFAPDGRSLAAGGESDIAIWDFHGIRPTQVLRGCGEVWSLGLPAGGRDVVFAANFTEPRRQRLDTVPNPEVIQAHPVPLRSMALARDGRRLATGEGDFTHPFRPSGIRVWDLDTGKFVPIEGHSADVTAMAFTPDGRAILSGAYNGEVALWASSTGARLDRLSMTGEVVCSVSISPDGMLAAVGTGGAGAKLDAHYALPRVGGSSPSGSRLHLLKLRGDRLVPIPVPQVVEDLPSVRFSPDGTRLAVASAGSLRLFDVGTWREHVVPFQDGVPECMEFSPDNQRLAIGTIQSEIAVLDLVRLGQPPRLLRGHLGVVTALAFSPDSRTLVSGNAEFSIKFWNPSTGQELASLRNHSDNIWSVLFSPDGHTLYSASRDRTVRIWRAASPETIRQADPDRTGSPRP